MSLLHLKSDDFDEAISEGRALVDFWASWCMPCRSLGPVIEALAEEYGDSVTVAKVDVDSERALATRYRVMSIPTVVLFKDGAEVKRFVGVQPKEVYERELVANA